MSEQHTPKVIAGEVAILARRYAQALIELAEEKKQLEAVEADVLAVEEAIIGHELFHRMATHPRLSKVQVMGVVKSMAEQTKLNDTTTAFLLQVVRNSRLAQLVYIIDSFKALLAEKRGEYTAFVKAPQALSEAQQKSLASQLSQMTGGTVKVVVEEDASLLGGLTIKLGSRLIDASVKGRLTQIERHLKKQQEAA